MQRTKLEREERSVETPLGTARVKVCFFENEVYCYPEHESVAELSSRLGLGYKEVYHLVKTLSMEAFLHDQQ